MTEIWNAWCLFWGIADAAIIVGLLAVAAWSSMPKRNSKRGKLNPSRPGYEDLLFLAQTWREQEAIKRDIAHAPDCAIALNARHECSCGQNAKCSHGGTPLADTTGSQRSEEK